MLIRLDALRKLLNEATRAKKLGVELTSGLDELALLVGSNHYVTFSHLNKVGINPQSSFNTPVGIYTYILDDEFFSLLKKGKITFATDREYAHVVRPRDQSTLIDVSSMNAELAFSLANKINAVIGRRKFLSLDEFMSETRHAKGKSPGVRFWYLSMMASRTAQVRGESSKTFAWNKLMRRIGIDGVVDHGDGIIHENEPSQAVFFSLSSIDLVATVNNPVRKNMSHLVDDIDDGGDTGEAEGQDAIETVDDRTDDMVAQVPVSLKMLMPYVAHAYREWAANKGVRVNEAERIFLVDEKDGLVVSIDKFGHRKAMLMPGLEEFIDYVGHEQMP